MALSICTARGCSQYAIEGSYHCDNHLTIGEARTLMKEYICKVKDCDKERMPNQIYCRQHAFSGLQPAADVARINNPETIKVQQPSHNLGSLSIAERYPQYYKSVEGYKYIDVYLIHHLYQIQDPSGMIQHASKKLLLSGVRTGGKSQYEDIKEARDTLNRWLELNPKLAQ